MTAADDVVPDRLAAKLLHEEYPADMAAAGCTCLPNMDPPFVCGGHRLLARYELLYAHMAERHLSENRGFETLARLVSVGEQLRGELEAMRDRLDRSYEALDGAAGILHDCGLVGAAEDIKELLRSAIRGLCDCPLCPDRTHGGENG